MSLNHLSLASGLEADVPNYPLGELGEFVRGNGLQKADLTEEGFPAIHYGEIHTHYGVWTDHTKSFTSRRLASTLKRAQRGNLIIATTSEDDESVAKATAWLGQSEVAISGDAYIFRHNLEPRYISYVFQTSQFQDMKRQRITGTKVRRISDRALAKIRIPVPPLEMQAEIASVLDRFTKLKAELKAELEARDEQYGYFRDKLLAFDEAVA